MGGEKLLLYERDGLNLKKLPAMQETQEMQVQFLGWEETLEEGMATHSSILAWRIPRTKKPDRLVRPHVIAHSLPTMRGTRCFKPSKNRFLRKVRKLLV